MPASPKSNYYLDPDATINYYLEANAFTWLLGKYEREYEREYALFLGAISSKYDSQCACPQCVCWAARGGRKPRQTGPSLRRCCRRFCHHRRCLHSHRRRRRRSMCCRLTAA